MIKDIEITNFESHEHTKIAFSDGLNTIVGKSNSGKSSIIRAASVAVANKWMKEQVRFGCDTCKIKVATDKGWVECERGEKVNKWRCFDGTKIEEYKNVGIGVPEQVTAILGMGELNRGDFKEMPNFMFQLDKHYMLSEIDGKKATANMVARMMDNAIGLGGMEDLIKDLSTDLVKDKKWLTEKQNEIIELKSEIIDDLIFDGYEKNQKEIKELCDFVNDTETSIFSAEKMLNDYQSSMTKVDESRKRSSLFPDVSSLDSSYSELKLIESKIEDFSDVVSVQSKIAESSKYLSIDVSDSEKLADELKSIVQKISNMESDIDTARKIWKNLHSANKELDENSKNIVILNQELEDFKKELGVCPVCGKSFDEDEQH